MERTKTDQPCFTEWMVYNPIKMSYNTMDDFEQFTMITCSLAFLASTVTMLGLSLYTSCLIRKLTRTILTLNGSVNEMREKFTEYNEDDEDSCSTDSDDSCSTDSDELDPVCEYEFENGTHAYWIDEADGRFILVMPNHIIRGDELLNVTRGHVSRSNPEGVIHITYEDDDCEFTANLHRSETQFYTFLSSKLQT